MTLRSSIWYTSNADQTQGATVTRWPNWVDLIIVTTLLRTCYSGFGRGLWSELLRVLAVVTATALSVNYYRPVSEWAAPWMWFGTQTGTLVIFCLIFLILAFSLHLLAKRVSDLIGWERVHWSIQGLGMLLGGLRGLWCAGFLLVIFAATGVEYLNTSVTKQSIFGPGLEKRAREAITLVANRFPGASERTRLTPRAR